MYLCIVQLSARVQQTNISRSGLSFRCCHCTQVTAKLRATVGVSVAALPGIYIMVFAMKATIRGQISLLTRWWGSNHAVMMLLDWPQSCDFGSLGMPMANRAVMWMI